jgi:hypothetical protein
LSNAFAFHPLGFSIRWEIVFAINLFGCGSSALGIDKFQKEILPVLGLKKGLLILPD